MFAALQRILGKEHVSETELDLEAYSYDASCMKQKPAMVAWPINKEHIRKILVHTNRTNTNTVCRGQGNNLVGSAIGENAVILDFSKMSRILNVDTRNNIVEVEPGITIQELNAHLKQYNRFFPIFPEEFVTSVGGLIALDLKGPYSAGFGGLIENIVELDCFDGTGKFFSKADIDETIGWEGTTSIITRVKLKIVELPLTKSLDLISVNNLPVLFNRINSLKKNPSVLSMEFFDKTASTHLNFEQKYNLLVEYTSDEGEVRDQTRIKQFVNKRKNLYNLLRAKDYYFIEDPKLAPEKLYDLIQWCEKHELPCYGHASFGILKVMFKKEQANLKEELYYLIRDWAGIHSGIYGYGLLKKQYLPPGTKHKLIQLKEKRDYNNILNRGKLIDFR